MRIFTNIVIAASILCLAACSKQSGSSEGASAKQRYVPDSAQAIMSSAEWKLDFTTKAGIRCYVKTVTDDVRKRLANDFEHADHGYLQQPSEPSQPAYLLVPIRNGTIIKEPTFEEGAEITGYILKHDKGFNDMLKGATR